jgi:predicted Fe-Mo cluster-binding NifX family protein
MLEIAKEAKVQAVINTAAASQLGKMMIRYFHQNGVKVINIVRSQQ